MAAMAAGSPATTTVVAVGELLLGRRQHDCLVARAGGEFEEAGLWPTGDVVVIVRKTACDGDSSRDDGGGSDSRESRDGKDGGAGTDQGMDEVYWVGRTDRQLKRHGQRINLDDMATRMLSAGIGPCVFCLCPNAGEGLAGRFEQAMVDVDSEMGEARMDGELRKASMNIVNGGMDDVNTAWGPRSGATSAPLPLLVCFVVGDDPSEGNTDVLRRRTRRCLAAQEFPDDIVVVAALPLTSHGKVDRRLLTGMYARQQAGNPPRAEHMAGPAVGLHDLTDNAQRSDNPVGVPAACQPGGQQNRGTAADALAWYCRLAGIGAVPSNCPEAGGDVRYMRGAQNDCWALADTFVSLGGDSMTAVTVARGLVEWLMTANPDSIHSSRTAGRLTADAAVASLQYGQILDMLLTRPLIAVAEYVGAAADPAPVMLLDDTGSAAAAAYTTILTVLPEVRPSFPCFTAFHLDIRK